MYTYKTYRITEKRILQSASSLAHEPTLRTDTAWSATNRWLMQTNSVTRDQARIPRAQNRRSTTESSENLISHAHLPAPARVLVYACKKESGMKLITNHGSTSLYGTACVPTPQPPYSQGGSNKRGGGLNEGVWSSE